MKRLAWSVVAVLLAGGCLDRPAWVVEAEKRLDRALADAQVECGGHLGDDMEKRFCREYWAAKDQLAVDPNRRAVSERMSEVVAAAADLKSMRGWQEDYGAKLDSLDVTSGCTRDAYEEADPERHVLLQRLLVARQLIAWGHRAEARAAMTNVAEAVATILVACRMDRP